MGRLEFSAEWRRAFLKRHNLKLSSPKEVEGIKFICKKVIEMWFEETEAKYKISQCNPHLLFNCDETMLSQLPPKNKVVSERGDKRIATIIKENSLPQHITLMVCVSAKPSPFNQMKTTVILPTEKGILPKLISHDVIIEIFLSNS